jgi:hypothetical protein
MDATDASILNKLRQAFSEQKARQQRKAKEKQKLDVATSSTPTDVPVQINHFNVLPHIF